MERPQLLIFTIMSILFHFSGKVRSAGFDDVKDLRISEKKCQEFKEQYRTVYESPLPYPHNQPVIGNLTCPKFNVGMIVGGRDALPFEYPHMSNSLMDQLIEKHRRSKISTEGRNIVETNHCENDHSWDELSWIWVSLMFRHGDGSIEHGCAGSLISDRFILTAAHCINSEIGIPIRAVLGDIALKSPKTQSWIGPRRQNRWSKRKELFIKDVFVHPNYNPTTSVYHDIALLELSEKLNLERRATPRIRPACLPQPYQFNKLSKVISTGWGRISEASDVYNILQTVELSVEDQKTCNQMYSLGEIDFRSRFPNEITGDLICAGDIGKDTCAGDSGGPLIVSLKDLPCMHYVVGVTSLGSTNCQGYPPGIYTRVEKYLDWIESIVWN